MTNFSLKQFYFGKFSKAGSAEGGYLVTAHSDGATQEEMEICRRSIMIGNHSSANEESFTSDSYIYALTDDYRQVWARWRLTDIYDRGHRLPFLHVIYTDPNFPEKTDLVPLTLMQRLSVLSFEPTTRGKLPILSSADILSQVDAINDKSKRDSSNTLLELVDEKRLNKLLIGIGAAITYKQRLVLYNVSINSHERLTLFTQLLYSIPENILPTISFATQVFEPDRCTCLLQCSEHISRASDIFVYDWSANEWLNVPPESHLGILLVSATEGNGNTLEKFKTDIAKLRFNDQWRLKINDLALTSRVNDETDWKLLPPILILEYARNNPTEQQVEQLLWAFKALIPDDRYAELIDDLANTGELFQPMLAVLFQDQSLTIKLFIRWSDMQETFPKKLKAFFKNGHIFPSLSDKHISFLVLILQTLNPYPVLYTKLSDHLIAYDDTSAEIILQIVKYAPAQVKKALLEEVWNDKRLGKTASKRLLKFNSVMSFNFTASHNPFLSEGQSITDMTKQIQEIETLLTQLSNSADIEVDLHTLEDISEDERIRLVEAADSLFQLMNRDSNHGWKIWGRDNTAAPTIKNIILGLKKLIDTYKL